MANGQGISIKSILRIEDDKERDEAILEMQFAVYENTKDLPSLRTSLKNLTWAVRLIYISIAGALTTIIGVVFRQ